MQLSFRQKEQLFYELEQLSKAGIPFTDALKTVGRNQRSALGRSAAHLREGWEKTGSASEAFMAAGFEASDAALVSAGAESGRLEEIFAELGKSYAEKAAARSAIIAHLGYPVFVFHLGVIVSAILPAFLAGSMGVFFGHIALFFGAFYFLLAVLWVVMSVIFRYLRNDPDVARLVRYLPFFNQFFMDWSGWNFALVLSLYLKAGGGILEAFRAAGLSCGNAALRAQAEATVEAVKQGSDLADSFCRGKDAPDALISAVEIGEKTGRLDLETFRAALICKERSIQKLTFVSNWLPRIFYFFVMLFMIWQILEVAGQVRGLYSGF